MKVIVEVVETRKKMVIVDVLGESDSISANEKACHKVNDMYEKGLIKGFSHDNVVIEHYEVRAKMACWDQEHIVVEEDEEL